MIWFQYKSTKNKTQINPKPVKLPWNPKQKQAHLRLRNPNPFAFMKSQTKTTKLQSGMGFNQQTHNQGHGFVAIEIRSALPFIGEIDTVCDPNRKERSRERERRAREIIFKSKIMVCWWVARSFCRKTSPYLWFEETDVGEFCGF